MLEVLAAQRGQPHAQRYMDGDGLDDSQHASNWQQISNYLRTITVANLTVHVPLMNGRHSFAKSDPPPPVFLKSPYDLLV